MSEQGAATPPAGWYPDPQGPDSERWFDGQSWTTGVRPVPAVVPSWQPPREEQAALRPALQPAFQQPVLEQPYLRQPEPAFQQPYQASFEQQPWQQPAKTGMPGWAKALIAVAAVGVGLVVLGILAAIAIPVFLNQRNAAQVAELSSVTCADLAATVTLDSVAAPTEDGPYLVEVKGVELVDDARGSVEKPQPGAEAFVMTCVGTAVWDDMLEEPVQIDLFVDSAMEQVYYLGWSG